MVVNRGHFGCPVCPDSFGSQGAVASHVRAKHGLLTCTICGSAFRSQQAVDQHKNAKHSFGCSECDDEYYTAWERDQHYEEVHRWVDCPECDWRFKTQGAVNRHYNSEHRFGCPDCNCEFKTQAAVDQHWNAEHRFGCPDCNAEFITRAAMIQHHGTVHTWYCTECTRVFLTENGRDQHYDAKHLFKCSECDDKFTTEVGREKHYDVRHRFGCPTCFKYFTTERILNQHVEVNHRLRCAYRCPDTFGTELGRMKHYEKKHTFPCPKCAKIFVTATELRNHEESDHKTYPCPKCPGIFETEGAMNQHVDSAHRPLPPPPALPRVTAKGREPDCVKGDDTNPPPRTPTDEAPDETTTSAADPSQDQGTAPSNRFYCQEEDCGRGFSTKGFLDTHVKFFHPKKPGNSSSNTPQTVNLERGTPDDGKENDEGALSGEEKTSLAFVTSRPGKRGTSADIANQFRCRICDECPSVETQPAATFCGHLFCYKCIMPKVTSTSKCPVCHTSILADRVFRLDISS